MALFRDIVGQDIIKEHLQNAIALDKVSHAYIVYGEKNSGKKMLAKTFAMALQCEAGQSEPCLVCRSCKQAMNNNHPDIKIVEHEKPNSIGVDEIRAGINGDIAIKPYQGPRKIYIVPDAEKMTIQAQNALLKTLEEPPAYAVILLLTTTMEGLLPTILSRCVSLNIQPVSDAELETYLMKTVQIPDYKAKVCSAFARGNVGRALLLANSEEFEELKSEVLKVLKGLREMEIAQMVQSVKYISERKFNVSDYLDLCLLWFRDVLVWKACEQTRYLVFKEELQAIKQEAKSRTFEKIEEVMNAISTANARIKANVNVDLTLEILFMTIQDGYR